MVKKVDMSPMMADDVPGELLTMFEDHYAVRCFLDGQRQLTSELTKKEAALFKKTALHLVKYLNKTYHLVK